MKILILGASGFMGRHFGEIFSKNHTIFLQYKDTANLLESEEVKKLLIDTAPDVVINCVTYGGNEKVSKNDTEDLTKNLAIAYNFYKHSDLFKLYINLGSGIENDIHDHNAYSISKKLIRKLFSYKENFINLRVYGCFGKYEKNKRLFKRVLDCYKTKEVLTIENRYFDYISIQDLSNVIEAVISIYFSGSKPFLFNDIDCVYPGEKKNLFDIVSLFCRLNSINIQIEAKESKNSAYVGNSEKIQSLINDGLLNLMGIDHGMKEYIE